MNLPASLQRNTQIAKFQRGTNQCDQFTLGRADRVRGMSCLSANGQYLDGWYSVPNPKNKAMQATLKFPNRVQAYNFARLWSHHTLTGYSLSATQPNGTVSLTLNNVTDKWKEWIDIQVAILNSELKTKISIMP